MAIRLAAGRDAKVGIKPKVAGRTYGTGFWYLLEMSEGSNLTFEKEVTEQEVYGADAKNVGGSDAVSFECTAFATSTTGQIHKITVGTPGSGYTSAPTVSIAAPPAGGVQATAIAVIENGTVVEVFITNPGEGYTSAPAVTFSGGAGTGAAATAGFGGITDQTLYDLLKQGDIEVEFSPNGGTTSSKKTKFTFDFTRESFNIEPAVNGVISIPFSGKAQNVVKGEW